jgi:hypothetical protein
MLLIHNHLGGLRWCGKFWCFGAFAQTYAEYVLA